ncbi:uncharacterized protein LOC135210697 [Macrobrachium nipponense]|uniref:uncharacterized protein LOC135210697 n=1 Tax=Macrobrachium nipponense TaxID=159736 RepID=UPI0030C8089E
MMAAFELQNEENPFLNKIIQEKLLKHRTTDGISGKRKSRPYRKLIEEMKKKSSGADSRDKTQSDQIEEQQNKGGDRRDAPILKCNKEGTLPSQAQKKLGWTTEELHKMAKLELSVGTMFPHFNKHIHAKLLNYKTLDSIRSKRRTREYQEILNRARPDPIPEIKKQTGVPKSPASSPQGRNRRLSNLRRWSVVNLLEDTTENEEEERNHDNGNLEPSGMDTTRDQDGMNHYLEDWIIGAGRTSLPIEEDQGREGVPSSPSQPSSSGDDSGLQSNSEPDIPTVSQRSPNTIGHTEADLERMKKEIFGERSNQPRARNTRSSANQDLPRRIWRRREYAIVQRTWKKNRGAVARNILDGKDPLADPAYPPGTGEFWGALFSRESHVTTQRLIRLRGNATENLKISIIEEVTIEDIRWAKNKTKLGNADEIRIAQFYNIILNECLITDLAALG